MFEAQIKVFSKKKVLFVTRLYVYFFKTTNKALYE